MYELQNIATGETASIGVGRYVIGRDQAQCQIFLDEPFISRLQAAKLLNPPYPTFNVGFSKNSTILYPTKSTPTILIMPRDLDILGGDLFPPVGEIRF